MTDTTMVYHDGGVEERPFDAPARLVDTAITAKDTAQAGSLVPLQQYQGSQCD